MTILTVFRSRLRPEAEAAYHTLAVEMSQLASETPGFRRENIRCRRWGARHARIVRGLIQSCSVARSPTPPRGTRHRKAIAVLRVPDLLGGD